MTDREPASARQSSDELLRLILEGATDLAIFSTDPNGVVTSWNAGTKRDMIFTPADQGAGTPQEERCQTRARPLGTGGEDAEWVGTMTNMHDLRTLQDREQVGGITKLMFALDGVRCNTVVPWRGAATYA